MPLHAGRRLHYCVGVGGSIIFRDSFRLAYRRADYYSYYTIPTDLISASDIANYYVEKSCPLYRYRYDDNRRVLGGASLVHPIIKGIASSFNSVSNMHIHGIANNPRTERDMKITTVIWCVLVLLCPIYFIFHHFISIPALHLSMLMQQTISWISVILVLTLGFVLASVCAYFAGLVGSSASPLSSMSLIALIIGSFILSLLLSNTIVLDSTSVQAISIAGIAIILTAVIASIASISLDTLQDLKAGQMVGATPWKQQVMLIVGVIVAALVIPLILQLLLSAYGLNGAPLPRPDMDPTQMLSAPQASLMAAVVQGIFTHNVQWDMMSIGGLIAIIALILDNYTRRYGGECQY